jgi:hypothetical protein
MLKREFIIWGGFMTGREFMIWGRVGLGVRTCIR